MRVNCLHFYVTFLDSVFNVFVYLLVLLQVEIKLLNECCLFYHFQPNVNIFYKKKKKKCGYDLVTSNKEVKFTGLSTE